jgi:long-subunit acyl-CoA synthetase (AMP-forming)
MSSTIEAVRHFAARTPQGIAVRSAGECLAYGALEQRAHELAREMEARDVGVVALIADNCPEWLVVDLAAQIAGTVLVPLPPFFTREQIAHALNNSAADTLLAEPCVLRDFDFGVLEPLARFGSKFAWCRLRASSASPIAAGTAKISYTSGTTGTPKGVCLRQTSMDTVASSLREAVADLRITRHLCVLPLATLLENIAGVYAPLMNGAEIVVPSARDTGLLGASRFDPSLLLRCIDTYRAESIILVPQLLAALLAALERGAPPPATLKLMAVGGGRVSSALLARADRLGLPVYEGYGLTECASVVALNTPAARRCGSAGRPLPHAAVTIDAHGEIHVAGAAVSGYVGDKQAPRRVATGDLGHFDADGFLYVRGRRKNMFITSFGRNVSPEWVEAELCEEPAIAQAAVFGEARPWNVAVIVPAPGMQQEQLRTAIEAANRRLPDYARVGHWLVATRPFTPANGELTTNGRNRRTAIWARYGLELDALYDESLELTA